MAIDFKSGYVITLLMTASIKTPPLDELTLTRPDDWHLHVRDGEMLGVVLPYSAAQFGRAIIMPNLSPPVTSLDAAMQYRARIHRALMQHKISQKLAIDTPFQPLMTCYLTDDSDVDVIAQGYTEKIWLAAKLYPAHATTNSAHGVTNIGKLSKIFEQMQKIGMILLVHGEVTDKETDIFDREKVFIERVLSPLMRDFPALKIVLEHVTTSDAVDFITEQPTDRLAATITAHHLHINRNDLFKGGIRPHYYCLPIAKRESHRLALIKAATSGSHRFFLGTDSAPHLISAKHAACGCAGIFTAPHALEHYVEIFDAVGKLDKFEGFASFHGADFYGLPRNEGKITLRRVRQKIPDRIDVGHDALVPFRGGEEINWQFAAGPLA